MRDKINKSACINDAIAVIQRREFSDYIYIARKYKCYFTIVFKCVYSFTKFKKEANSF